MRASWLGFILLVLLPVTAPAQVAAPRLDPVGPETLTNPATFVWSDRSRAGGGLVQWGSETDSDTLAKGPGLFAQGRYVGETFAVGGAVLYSKLKQPQTYGGGDMDTTESTLGAAYAPHESFSLGVAVENFTSTDPDTEFTRSLPLIGLGLRISDVFFLGYAFGTETIASQVGSYGTSEAQAGQQRLGFAYRQSEGDLKQRYEIAWVMTESIRSGVFRRNWDTFTNLSAEWVFAELLVGIELGSSQMTTSGPNAKENGGIDILNLHGGWAPNSGIAMTLILRQVTDYENTIKTTITIVFVGAAWQF